MERAGRQVKKIGKVSPHFGWRASPVLIHKVFWWLQYIAAMSRTTAGLREGRLTTRGYVYIIDDKSDEGRDASLRVEMGNLN